MDECRWIYVLVIGVRYETATVGNNKYIQCISPNPSKHSMIDRNLRQDDAPLCINTIPLLHTSFVASHRSRKAIVNFVQLRQMLFSSFGRAFIVSIAKKKRWSVEESSWIESARRGGFDEQIENYTRIYLLCGQAHVELDSLFMKLLRFSSQQWEYNVAKAQDTRDFCLRGMKVTARFTVKRASGATLE